jgi:hypothetical protein
MGVRQLGDLGARSGMAIDLEFIPWTPNSDLATAVEIVTTGGFTERGGLGRHASLRTFEIVAHRAGGSS